MLEPAARSPRVYPRYRLVNYDPVVIETERGFTSINDPRIARILLIVAHTPGSEISRVAWSYVVSAETENVDTALEEAYELIEELARRGLILVV